MIGSCYPRLNDYFRNNSGVLLIQVDVGLLIRDVNAAFTSVVGAGYLGACLPDLVGMEKEAFLRDVIHSEDGARHLFNFRMLRDMPETYYFHFFENESGYLFVGEQSATEIQGLRDELMNTASDMSALMREVSVKNKELQGLNKLKNQFLGMASHDLRNPIGVIMGYADFMRIREKKELSDKHLEIMDSIKSAATSMLGLLNSFLDISSIEEASVALDLKPVKLADQLEKNITENQMMANNKSIRLHLNVESTVPEVYADVQKFHQIVTNIVSNAIKYSYEESDVFIEVYRVPDEAYVTFKISDSGQGIPKGEQAGVFNPYARTSVKPTAGEKSTGLGLAIVKQLVVAHKGKAWLESEVGKGSCFYFTLPCCE